MADAEVTIGFKSDGSEVEVAAQVEAALKKAGGGQGQNLTAAFAKGLKLMNEQLKLFEARMRAVSRSSQKIDFDPGNFLVMNRALERAHDLGETFASDIDQISQSQGRLNALQAAGKINSSEMFAELGRVQSMLKNLGQTQRDTIRGQQQTERLAAQAARTAASERIVAAQTAAAREVAATKAAAQRRITILQIAARQIEAIERGLAAVFRTTAHAIGASFRGVGSVINSALAPLRNFRTNLTAGFSASLGSRERTMRSSFSRQETILSSSINRQSATITRFERQLSGGLAGAATGRSAGASALGIGGFAAGAGGLTALLTSGFARFSELERLNKQFIALTGSIEETAILMQQVKDFAKVTPFDLVGVANLAKGFLAIGTATEDVLPRIKVIADAVALTGGGTDALERIQRAIGQVVSAGRLQGDELNQLAENLPGLNIRKILADQLTGGDVAALVELQEAGELSADMFVNGLITGLGSDPRLVGASEDLANTLSGRFANLKESFADLGASLIGLIAGPLKTVASTLQTAFAGAAQFIRGENLSAGLETLRVAAQGAAIALGGLLVAKAAGEALQILSIGLRAVLTPMGLLIAGAALIGAAIAVMAKRSEAFRTAITTLGDKLRELAGTALAFFEEKIGQFADFLGTTVIPALTRFADFVGDNLFKGLQVAATFIRDQVIPRLREFATFVTSTVVPAVRDGLVRGFNAAKDGIASFWQVVEPILAPAISGMQSLVDAVKQLADIDPSKGLIALGGILAAAVGGFAVAGPAGAAIAGLGAAVGAVFFTGLNDEVGEALSGFGDVLVSGLRSAASRIGGALGNIFTLDNVFDVAGIALNLVEKLAFFIGRAVSDPRLVAAVAGIAGFAALAALRFIEGFGRGILENVPELGNLIQEGLEAALESVVQLDTSTIGKVLLATFGGLAVLRIFGVIGGNARKAFSQGFASGVPGVGEAGLGGGTRGFIEGLFGGANLNAALDRDAARIAKRFRSEFDRNNRILASTGADTISRLGITDTQALTDSRNAIRQVGDALGEARVQGEFFRTSLRNLGTGVALRDLGAVRTAIGDLGSVLKSQARNIGAGLGVAVAASFGVAFGAQMIIESKGMADTLTGALSVVGSAGAAFAVGGPALAGLTLALGGITAFFQHNQRAAEDAKKAVDRYAQALEGVSEIDQISVGATSIIESLKNETLGVQNLFRAAGFQMEEFEGLTKRVFEGSIDPVKEFTDVLVAIGGPLGELGKNFASIDPKVFEDTFGKGGTFRATGELADQLERLGVNAEDIRRLYQAISTESDALFKGAREAANQDAFRATREGGEASLRSWELVNAAIDAALAEDRPNLAEIQVADTVAELEAAKRAADEARIATDDFLNGDYGDTLQAKVDEFVTGLGSVGTRIEEALVVPPGAIQDALLRGIGDEVTLDLRGAIKVGLAEGSITATPEGVAAALSGIQASVQALVDSGQISPTVAFAVNAEISEILNSGEIPTLITNLITAGVIPAVPFDLSLLPSFTIASGVDIADEISKAVSEAGGPAGFGGGGAGPGNAGQVRGVSPTKVDVPLEINPVITTNLGAAETAAAAAGQRLAAGFTLAFGLSLLAAVSTASTVSTLVATNLGLGAATAAAAGVIIAQRFAAGIISGTGAAIAAAGRLGASASGAVRSSTGQAFAAGVAIAQGLAAGINSGASQAINAARNMALRAAQAARAILQIASPSGVFKDIGLDIGRGLAQGIADGADSAVSAMNSAMDDVLDAAFGAVDARAGGIAGIFELVTSTRGLSSERVQTFAGLADLPEQLAARFDQSAQDLWNAVVARNEGTADARQRGIAGELDQFGNFAGFQSLNSALLLGSQNAQAFLELGNQIKQFASQSLQEGVGVGTVIADSQRYRDELIQVAASYGANMDELAQLIRILGLADDQLAEFARQAQDFTNAANAGATPTPDPNATSAGQQAEQEAREEAERLRHENEKSRLEAENERLREALRVATLGQRPVEVTITPPFGDPEAIGLAAANRVASELNRAS